MLQIVLFDWPRLLTTLSNDIAESRPQIPPSVREMGLVTLGRLLGLPKVTRPFSQGLGMELASTMLA